MKASLAEAPLISIYALFYFFVSGYFILLDAAVHGIVFLIPFWDCSLLVCRNPDDFLCVDLGPANLLNPFIDSRRFLVDPLGFSACHLKTEIAFPLPLQFG